MKLFFKTIYRIEQATATLFLSVMTVLVILQVFLRYFGFPTLAWGEEVMRYLFIWMIFIAASLVIKQSGHLGISTFVDMLPPVTKKIIAVFTMLVCMLLCAFIAYHAYKNSMFQLQVDQTSPALGLPMGWVTFCIPVGCTLVILALLEKLIMYREAVEE